MWPQHNEVAYPPCQQTALTSSSLMEQPYCPTRTSTTSECPLLNASKTGVWPFCIEWRQLQWEMEVNARMADHYTILGHNMNFTKQRNPTSKHSHALPAGPLVQLLQKLSRDNPLLDVTSDNNHRSNTNSYMVAYLLQYSLCGCSQSKVQYTTIPIVPHISQVTACGAGEHQQTGVDCNTVQWHIINWSSKSIARRHVLMSVHLM